MTKEKTIITAEQKKDEKIFVVKKDEKGNKGRRNNRRGDKKREEKEFEEAIIQISRVTRVVKGGRRMRFRIAVVIGDKKGKIGFGIGKSSEVLGGIQKAVFAAKKNLINISIDKNTNSIPHDVKGKFKASQVLLFPAPEGKGVVAGSAVRKILELSGVKNVLSKIHGSRNRLNTTRATFAALKSLANYENPGKKEEIIKKKEKNMAKETVNKK
jgi:small subunit ribosomal protein S5